jgi:hypothetical protein
VRARARVRARACRGREGGGQSSRGRVLA